MEASLENPEGPFYRNGLRFTCRQCSNCCRHEPGYVFLTEKDLNKLARAFKMSHRVFIDTYCRTIDFGPVKRLSLSEKDNYDCIFWVDGKCKVYRSRPLQCISYPFWETNLSNEKVWNALEKECPGVNSGKLHGYKEIQGWIEKRRNNFPLSPPETA